MHFSGLSQGGGVELSRQQAKSNKHWRWGPADYTVKGTAFPTLSYSPCSTCNTYINKHLLSPLHCALTVVESWGCVERNGLEEIENIKPVFVLHCCTHHGELSHIFFFSLQNKSWAVLLSEILQTTEVREQLQKVCLIYRNQLTNGG